MVGTEQIAMYGGSNDESEKMCDLWFFDLKSNKWNKVDQKFPSEMDQPGPRSGHSITHSGNYLIVFGGIFEVTNELNDIFRFDL